MIRRISAADRKSRPAVLCGLFLSIAFLLFALPSRAQSGARRRDRNRDLDAKEKIKKDLLAAQLRFGRMFILSKFQVGSPTLEQLGNVSWEVDQPLYVPGTEKNDFALYLRAPQKIYYVLNRKMLFSVDAAPSYLYYLRAHQFRDFGWLLRGDLHFVFNRLYLDFYSGGSDQLWRSTSELRTLVPERQSNWGGRSELLVSSRTQLTFGGAKREYRYGNVDLGTFFFRDIGQLARTENEYDFQIKHQTFPVATMALGGSVTHVNFDDPTVSDAKETQGYIQYRRQDSHTTIVIQPGFAKLDFDDPSLDRYSGAVGYATMDVQKKQRWTFGLSAERRLEFSLFGRNDYYAADRAGIHASKYFGRRIQLLASVEEGRNRYFVPTPVTTTGDEAIRLDKLTYESLGFTIRIARIETGLTVGHWQRDSNIAGFDDNGIRLLLHLSFSPGGKTGGG